MPYACRIDAALEIVADHKARSVGIGEDNQSARLSQRAQEPALLGILENAEAVGLQNHSVHHLAQGVLVIATFDHDDLFNPLHPSLPP